MQDVGYGKGYKYAHNFPGHVVEQQHLPDSLKDKKFYFPGELGYEKLVSDRLKAWSAIKKINDSDRKKRAWRLRVTFRDSGIQLAGKTRLSESKVLTIAGRVLKYRQVINLSLFKKFFRSESLSLFSGYKVDIKCIYFGYNLDTPL